MFILFICFRNYNYMKNNKIFLWRNQLNKNYAYAKLKKCAIIMTPIEKAGLIYLIQNNFRYIGETYMKNNLIYIRHSDLN